MATITANVPTNWTKLEDIIKAKDATFVLADTNGYEIQNAGTNTVRIFEGASVPTNSEQGGGIPSFDGASYTITTGEDLYLKSSSDIGFICLTVKAL